MSTARVRHTRFDRSAALQAALLLALALLAAGMTRWQSESMALFAPASDRVAWATGVLLAYAGFVAIVATVRTRDARRDRPDEADGAAPRDWLVAHASQTGHADALARRTWQALRDAGHAADLRALGTLDVDALGRYRRALFIAATTGEGDAPDGAALFARRSMATAATLPALHVGVLALGDRDYDAYCAFGRRLDAWLHASGAQPLFDRVEVDNGDPAALRHWQHHIGQIAGRTDLPDWSTPTYAPWTLAMRTLLNPGSVGGPVYLVRFTPPRGLDVAWNAGDIAEIGPRQPRFAITAWLRAHDLRGAASVRVGDVEMRLADALVDRGLHAIGSPAIDPQATFDAMPRLPHREYSIASIRSDGAIELVVRQVRLDNGRFGIGSGWLTAHAEVGDTVDLRVRSNPAFHAPDDARPVLLIGNGTGIAGLRALLKARIAQGHVRNWLVFGERMHAYDALFDDELKTWQAEGGLECIDRVYSRDGNHLRYVQDVLRTRAHTVREWVDTGASIYVCGSLEGMAPAVDATLRGIVGGERLDVMAADGRYRRDVY